MCRWHSPSWSLAASSSENEELSKEFLVLEFLISAAALRINDGISYPPLPLAAVRQSANVSSSLEFSFFVLNRGALSVDGWQRAQRGRMKQRLAYTCSCYRLPFMLWEDSFSTIIIFNALKSLFDVASSFSLLSIQIRSTKMNRS